MRIGVICRADQRGIGYQTRQFRDNMPVESTLVVSIPTSGWAEDLTPFDWNTDVLVEWDPTQPELHEQTVRDWLRRVDVVFAVESLYDWRIVYWAHSLRVKVVVQGNPEFYLHRQPEWPRPDPDEWWWPTEWLVADWSLPGRIMPVPTPSDVPEGLAADPFTGDLQVALVIGHSAHRDRAGAMIAMSALRLLDSGIHVHVHCQDADLPIPVNTSGLPLRCGVTVHTGGVDDRWDLYRGKHLVVSPRRYGGLSLPTLEAFAAGLAVAMPAGSPNACWPIVPLGYRMGPPIPTQAGSVPHLETEWESIASVVNGLAADRIGLAHDMWSGLHWAVSNSWAEWGPRYVDALQEVVSR